MGRAAFREKYGFGKSTDYFVVHQGRTLDSKPIIAVAFGYQHQTRALLYSDFSGGAATVEPVLRRLGFDVVYEDQGDFLPTYTSFALTPGEVYTRARLRGAFAINDATINNGIFRPKGTKSIWLFVTKEKTADRPQLHDSLDGDVLTWSGQTSGRTDKMVVDHLANGDEILVFYRNKRDAYPNGGFRYEGQFCFQKRNGARPASFTLTRQLTDGDVPTGSEPKPAANDFDPVNLADGRSQTLALVRIRQGQAAFRKQLLDAYDGKCAVTECAVSHILQAAHIVPYRGKHTNHVTNGILLRADIHTLFDLGLITIMDNGTLDVCSSLGGSEYARLKKVRFPSRKSDRPSPASLRWHRENVATDEARAAALQRLR